MKKLIAIAALFSFGLAHADSVYQWGAWDVNAAQAVSVTAPVVPAGGATQLGLGQSSASVGAAFTAPAELLQATATGGAPVVSSLDSDLQSFKSGNVTASYAGSSTLTANGQNLGVNLAVNFGQSTWSGTWSTQTAGFGASGSISGTSLTGNVNAGVASSYTGGTVTGVFSGTGANTITGTTNLTMWDSTTQSGGFTVKK